MVTPFARGAVLRQAGRAASLDELAGPGGILVLAPHPDDESLGMGAALAMAAAQGRSVQVVAVTRGDASHRSLRVPPPRLTQLRARELREALRTLGIGRPAIHLGHPDQGAPDTLDEEDAARLVPAAAAIGATRIWTCWEHDPHPDHGRTARMARALAARLGLPRPVETPVWGRFTETAPDRPVLRLAAPGWAVDAKRRAIAAHRSQMTTLIPDDPQGFVMDPATRAHFETEAEIFLP